MTAFTRTPSDTEGLSDATLRLRRNVATGTELTYELNRLAKSLSGGRSMLAAQAAANTWAASSNLSMLGALNAKNGTTDLGLRAVCNALGNTVNEDPAYALSQVATPA